MRAGTIVASNYSAMARVLGESFLDHHGDSTFTVLVVDDLPADFGERLSVARLTDLDLPAESVAVMKSIYDVMEFSTAVKPSFLRHLLDRPGDTDESSNVAVYLDPDIEVFAPFDDVVVPALEHGIVLTPHALEPVPRDGMNVSEGTIMQSGMYNCGFIAVSATGRAFLDWWDVRLRFDAVVDFEHSHFTDQRWVDWVPSLFDHHISRDPTMNVAWWNIHERPIERVDGRPMVAGRPVRFVHFSGYDPANPDLLSKHQLPSPRVAHARGTAMRALADAYGAQLVAGGHLELRRSTYPWNVSVDGVELTRDVRRTLRSALLSELEPGDVTLVDRQTPDAFGGGAMALSDWLGRTAAGVDAATPATDPPLIVLGGRSRAQRPKEILRRLLGTAGRLRDDLSRRAGTRTARRRQTPVGERRPFAFLHVPKSAGSSIVASLREAMGGHSWSDHVFDPMWMGPYRLAQRPPAFAHQVLESRDELHCFDAVAGHFTLDTLLSRFDAVDIATVVREPRCRLLSHYEYWRGLSDAEREAELPWESSRSAVSLDFADWLLDESIAYQSDNTLIRQLVDDPAIPENAFIPNDQLARLARLATARLRTLGFVGLVEEGDAVFERLGDFVGAPLERRRINVTERVPTLAVDLAAIFGRATPPLAARTAGDALVWHAAARLVGVADPAVSADAAWLRRLGASVATGSVPR